MIITPELCPLNYDLQEGAELLESSGGLEKTRGQTAAVKGMVKESKTTSPCKPTVIRDNTMVNTAQVRILL